MHPVFDVGLLRTYSNGSIQPPHRQCIDDEWENTVQEVLDHRVVKRGDQRKVEYLVKWLD